jgi:hypothetical protein
MPHASSSLSAGVSLGPLGHARVEGQVHRPVAGQHGVLNAWGRAGMCPWSVHLWPLSAGKGRYAVRVIAGVVNE